MPQGTRTSLSVATAGRSAAHELHSDSCCEPAHPCCAFGSITPFSSFGFRLPFPCGLSLAGATDGPCCVEDHLPRLCGHCCARHRSFPTVAIGFRSLPGAELPPTWTATVPCCGGVQLPAGRCSCHCCALGMPSPTPPVGFRTSSSLDGLCWTCATHCSDSLEAPPRAGRHDHPRCNFVPSACCAPRPGPAMTDRWPCWAAYPGGLQQGWVKTAARHENIPHCYNCLVERCTRALYGFRLPMPCLWAASCLGGMVAVDRFHNWAAYPGGL